VARRRSGYGGFEIDIDTHGIERKLLVLSRRELDKARRQGLTKAAKLGKARAQAEAPRGSGSHGFHGYTAIYYRTRSRRGFFTARVGIRGNGFWMRFLARGVTSRHTRAGWNRGRLDAVPFMQEAADTVDPRVAGFVSDEVRDAIRRARL
jgi:hypothetical protein